MSKEPQHCLGNHFLTSDSDFVILSDAITTDERAQAG
jgi:hypothetical protein